MCDYILRKEGNERVAIVDCLNCNFSSSLFDENCRNGLLKIFLKEPKIDKLILNDTLTKIFYGEELKKLKKMANFINELYSLNKCDCLGINEIIEMIKKNSLSNPAEAFEKIKALYKEIKKPLITEKRCYCRKDFKEKLKRLLDIKIEDYHAIHPYIKPIFFDTYIQFSPPSDSVFLKSYNIKRKGKDLKVSIYRLMTKPEKLYFIMPPEYNLEEKELILLQQVKEKLAKHHPSDTSFLDFESAREYFYRFGKEKMVELVNEKNFDIEGEKIEMLADIFAKYTAGIGILEDLLLDEKIQDIYINAPVSRNPVHIILDGEEYTTNIYFSPDDVEALSTRFRSMSGRAFSEASPILDAGLHDYGSRITAISPPLTPEGIAFAIRRHRRQPWTLPMFVANKMISPLAAGMLSFFVDGQATILIGGSRGAGKTSLLGALMLEIPQKYRIITIEDTPEIPIEKMQKLGYKIQSLLTKSAVAEEGIDEKVAIKTALRLGESVLVLGEVRGNEAKILFEAMRIGAAGNLVMGTIHGASCRDVFDRLVYDIGIPPSSFKATDIVVIAAPMRIGGKMEKKRRVVEIAEISKLWKNEDMDKVFNDIMVYDSKEDELKALDLFYMGQSEIIGKIAMQWGMSIEDAIENIKLRAKIKKKMAEYSLHDSRLVEAKAVIDANNAYWIMLNEMKDEIDYKKLEKKWMEWFGKYAKL